MKLLMGTRRIISASRSLPNLRRETLFSRPTRRLSHPLLTSTHHSLSKGIRFYPHSSPSLLPVILLAIRRSHSHLSSILNTHKGIGSRAMGDQPLFPSCSIMMKAPI